MRKTLAICLVLLLSVVAPLSALASEYYSENEHRFARVNGRLLEVIEEPVATYSSCSHTDFETYGATWQRYVKESKTKHRVETVQRAVCTSCREYTIVVALSSSMETHNMIADYDIHLSDTKHVYYEKCNKCGETDSYTRACGGIHTFLLQVIEFE